MLERLVAWFCNNYLGRYLENLNTDQLSVALLQGEVELENVPLRGDILDQLGLPIKIHQGYIGKICFQIPLRKIRSEPWVISFEQLHLVAGPQDKNEPFSEEAEDAAELERKLASLDLMEAEWRSENDPQSLSSSSGLYSLTYSSWLGYGASLVTNIVQNIQLKIKDIHIRYEDGISCPGRTFACGVRVESLTAQTCDDNWIPKFMSSNGQGIMYKVLELQGLAVYWDTNTDLYCSDDVNTSIEKLSVKLMQPCTVERHEFLLAPVSGCAHLKRNCSAKPLRSLNHPRVACDLQLERVNIELRDVQYHQLVQCCRSLELLSRGLQFRRWRYDSESNRVDRWTFATRCVLNDVRRRFRGRNWTFALQRARDIVSYVHSFKEHLLNPVSVTSESKLQRERIENELELEELQALRACAMQQIYSHRSQQQNKVESQSLASDATNTTAGSPTGPEQQTLFQRWFSSWWTADETDNGQQSASDERVEHEILETLEDAMRDNTVRQRDILPLQLSYTLKQGLVRLSTCRRTETGQSWATLLELELTNVVQEWESRPRLKSHRFHLSLSNVWVRDCWTPGTLFPHIVCTQRKEDNRYPFYSKSAQPPVSLASSFIPSFGGINNFFRGATTALVNPTQNEQPLFDLVYEKRPPSSPEWNHRLKVSSLAVECVYNRQLFDKVIELFFTVPHKAVSEDERSQIGQRLRRAARSGFEAVKQKTRQGWPASLQQLQQQQRNSSWDISIDISAPHILIPESAISRDSLLLVVDFGHLFVNRPDAVNPLPGFPGSWASSKAGSIVNTGEEDDDDEYCTPCSTPPNEWATAASPPSPDEVSVSSNAVTSIKTAVGETDKYKVQFADLQVLICRIKDNWKQAHLKGTSAHHLLDRFSITILAEKAGRQSLPLFPLSPGMQQPERPLLTLTASLPNLIAHINEQKIQALTTVATQFRTSGFSTSQDFEKEEDDEEPLDTEPDDDPDGMRLRESTQISDTMPQEPPSNLHWLMVQFSIDRLSVELQSRSRSVAELQVGGVQANYSIRSTDSARLQTSDIHISVHSLLLVDAMQTLGPDYELLVASHRHVSVDSTSGSLKESCTSEPTSPVSPSSPPAMADYQPNRATSPITLARALAASLIQTTQQDPSVIIPSGFFRTDRADRTEALIVVDITTVEPTWIDDEPEGRVHVVKVHFNSLDVIANQDTVVELASFFQRVLPSSSLSQKKKKSSNTSTPLVETTSKLSPHEPLPNPPFSMIGKSPGGFAQKRTQYSRHHPVPDYSTDITFDFNRLTVLLLRSSVLDDTLVGRKVATLTITEAHINASLAGNECVDSASVAAQRLLVQGSLGGFQVLDLTAQGRKHQRVISVGHDPLVQQHRNLYMLVSQGLYDSPASSSKDKSEPDAFSFKFLQLLRHSDMEQESSLQSEDDDRQLSLDVRMGSLCYTHSAHFLSEVAACVSEFQQSVTNMAVSLKLAAAEIAVDLMHRGTEGIAQSIYMSGPVNASISEGLSNLAAAPIVEITNATEAFDHQPSARIAFNALLDSPIIVLPRTAKSAQVLVAHLGQIEITNDEGNTVKPTISLSEELAGGRRGERFGIDVRDMSLYSLDVDEKWASSFSHYHNQHSGPSPAYLRVTAQELYGCASPHGRPILHDTLLKFTLQRITDRPVADRNLRDSGSDPFFSDVHQRHQQPELCDVFHIEGCVASPLNVSLSKTQYEQIIESLDNLNWDSKKIPDASTSSTSIPPFPGPTSGLGDFHSPSVRKSWSVPRRTPAYSTGQRELVLHFEFQLPSFSMQLLDSSDCAICCLSFDDLKVEYEKGQSHSATAQIALRSLQLDDLMMAIDSKHRRLVASTSSHQLSGRHDRQKTPKALPIIRRSHSFSMSSSCPNLLRVPQKNDPQQQQQQLQQQDDYGAGSLPARLEPLGPQWLETSSAHLNQEYPKTPPSSPVPPPIAVMYHQRFLRSDDGDDSSGRENLVLIKVLLIDPTSADFAIKYNSTRRFVEVDLNELDVVVNVESWVMVLDFFGASPNSGTDKKKSRKKHKSSETSAPSPGYQDWRAASGTAGRLVNSRWEVEVRSFRLLLNRLEKGRGYEVAEAVVTGLSWEMASMRGNLDVTGKLGGVLVRDLTPVGRQLYNERFVTTGNEALDFQFFRFSADDPHLARDYDIRLNINMASVLYVHTQRFYVECMSVLQQFQQLMAAEQHHSAPQQEKLEKSPPSNNRKQWKHGTRILLNVDAGSPVIVLPVCSSSEHLLVVDLSRISVSNHFDVVSSSTGSSVLPIGRTLRLNSATQASSSGPSSVLVDVLQVELARMDLSTGRRFDKGQQSQIGDLVLGSYLVRRRSASPRSLLTETCDMKVEVRRNLDGHLGRHTMVPDVDLRGLLTAVNCSVDEHQYKLVRGLLAFNLGEQLEWLQRPVPELKPTVWSTLKLRLDLVNVALELKMNDPDGREEGGEPFAAVEFIDSRLVYESNSNGSRDIDLVSQQVLLKDTVGSSVNAINRNVFTQILQPITSAAQSSSTTSSKDSSTDVQLQAEVHYRATKDFTRFTVVLNNMRLLAVPHWWSQFHQFIILNPDEYRGDAMNNEWQSRSAEVSPGANSDIAVILASSTGVLSKRAASEEPFMSTQQPARLPVEFRINISDSEVVIIENTSTKDSSAVILKGTALLTYRPQMATKPLSCQLNQVEIFSCSQLGGAEEHETALSIVDPVTISIEVVGDKVSTISGDVRGIPDATASDLHRHQTLEIQAQQLILRLSYNDLKLFVRILESIRPRQILSASQQEQIEQDQQVKRLEALGFTTNDCRVALTSCQGQLEEAALWLTKNAETITQDPFSSAGPTAINIRAIEIRTGCVSLCIIDDCRDADVPLLEVTASQLLLRQTANSRDVWGSFAALQSGDGNVHCQLAVDYYNRTLSGWEPFIEPFKCRVRWSAGRHWQFDADDVVNVNWTRALLNLFHTVKGNWIEDFYGSDGAALSPTDSSSSSVPASRQRSPFVPFALHNATGSSLKFRTQTASLLSPAAAVTSASTTSSAALAHSGAASHSTWIPCDAGDIVAFSFENRGKLRHNDSHHMQSHQLVIELDGWLELGAVSVDRVGVYFRYATIKSQNLQQNRILDRVLVVIAVSLEGSARRLVTVRSALQLTNNLEETVELRLEPTQAFSPLPIKTLRVPPCSTHPIPISHLAAQITVRPMAEKVPHIYGFCKEPISLQAWSSKQQQATGIAENTRHCNPVANNRDLPYRFAVSIHRENFPPDERINREDGPTRWTVQPAHTITLLSPLVVVNLLPYELLWEMKSISQSGLVKPGKTTSIHTVDLSDCSSSDGLQIAFRTENFVHSSDLVVSVPPPHNLTARLRLYDSANRLLVLQVKISSKASGSIKLSVSAPYWVVNKAGIPLIFRQDGVHQEAAGQFDEHEMARSLSPMLFSLADREAGSMMVARIGTGLHLGCAPQWCQPFALQKGVKIRSFHVTPRDGRPELVYLVGISIRAGRGRYRDTHIISLAPCYQLYNQSGWRLEVSQAYFATTFTDPGAQSTYLNLLPGCHLPFHWPRLDKDQLLCIRLPDDDQHQHGRWSGGFAIRNVSSFHVSVRDSDGGHPRFLRVEILQQEECTFRVVFSDAGGFPPPIRVDNLSQVSIVFHQSEVPEACLHTTVRPGNSVPYVWDEPTRGGRLTVIAPGGASSAYDMTTLKEGNQLTYENFIYVCLSVTFDDQLYNEEEQEQLVLDVPEGTRVVLNRKEAGQRSQLWRMTGSGMLQHEGSSPPRDPSAPHQVDPSRILVLDIAGPALQPSQYVHLMLRKPDPRRLLTQTWRFTDDGRLCCGHSNVFVQAKDGFYGVRKGNDVVLGPAQSVTYSRTPTGIPAEQAFNWQRLRPGSGCLSVKTITDGPTRVLQVTDLGLTNRSAALTGSRSVSVDSSSANSTSSQLMKVEMRFKAGLGLSIVNHAPPEELAYCRLSDVSLQLITGNGAMSIDASVSSIQVDNSLPHDPLCPVVVYVTPTVSTSNHQQQDESTKQPALHLSVHRQLTSQSNADIFKHLVVTFKNLTINIEENQLFKLLAFAGFNQSDLELERVDESDYESQRSLNAATATDAKRYYFGVLKLVLEQVRLSVYTSSTLPPELKAIKRKLGLTLIKFEDANIELDPFIRLHPFETARLIIDSIIIHYKGELKSQAARILGSTDFLGNPLGLVNDVTEGVSGLINDGNVGALVQNVTFGLSNSAAKFAGTLSNGLGRVTMDERHEELRQRLLRQTGSSSDPLTAGLKGFGFGMLGGITSVFTQTYEGVSSEGLSGLFTGFGKGLVGMVTKPTVGILDLATGAASAVRDSSRSSSKEIPRRIRPPRLVVGPGGILPRFSERQGRGQEILFELNRHLCDETFIAYEALGNLTDSLHMVISSENIRVFSNSSPAKEVVLEIHLSQLQSSKAVVIKDYGTQGATQYYVELNLNLEQVGPQSVRRPQVRCDSESLAKRVAQEINYAKSVYEENGHSLVSSTKFTT